MLPTKILLIIRKKASHRTTFIVISVIYIPCRKNNVTKLFLLIFNKYQIFEYVSLQVNILKTEQDKHERDLQSAKIDLQSTLVTELGKSDSFDENGAILDHINACYGPIKKVIEECCQRQENLLEAIHVSYLLQYFETNF